MRSVTVLLRKKLLGAFGKVCQRKYRKKGPFMEVYSCKKSWPLIRKSLFSGRIPISK